MYLSTVMYFVTSHHWMQVTTVAFWHHSLYKPQVRWQFDLTLKWYFSKLPFKTLSATCNILFLHNFLTEILFKMASSSIPCNRCVERSTERPSCKPFLVFVLFTREEFWFVSRWDWVWNYLAQEPGLISNLLPLRFMWFFFHLTQMTSCTPLLSPFCLGAGKQSAADPPSASCEGSRQQSWLHENQQRLVAFF